MKPSLQQSTALLEEKAGQKTMEGIDTLRNHFMETLGYEVDVVVLVHKVHHMGEGCNGVSVLAHSHPMVVMSMLQQATDNAGQALEMVIDPTPPQGTRLN